VDNFRDDAIQVSIVPLFEPPGSPTTPILYLVQLQAFDIHTVSLPNQGNYRIDFGTTAGPAALGTCTLNLGSGDQYQFVTLPDKIVVRHINAPALTRPDLIVATSSLCR
jgi:hypothetical protein